MRLRVRNFQQSPLILISLQQRYTKQSVSDTCRAGAVTMSSETMKQYLAKQPLLRKFWRRGRNLLHSFRTLNDYRYDWNRYIRWWHGVGDDQRWGQRQKALLKAYHGVEKGLSLRDRRPGFGQEKVKHLIRQIDEWEAAYGLTDVAVEAVAALRAYQAFNDFNDVNLPWLDVWLKSKEESSIQAGTKPVSKKAILDSTAGTGEEFFNSRYSMRQFGPASVPMDDIRKAVKLAQKTPSVCNRQGARVHCFEQANDALQYQPGNRGFGHLASRALVVTANLQAFSGSGERNQAWVDGGMFAMSLLYTLHALGFGACPLAWSQRADADRRVRQALNIPDHEVIIMMIAVGTLPEKFDVAMSRRLELEQVLIERAAQ